MHRYLISRRRIRALLALLLCCTAAHVWARDTVVRVGVYQNTPKIFLSKPDNRPSGIFGDLLVAIARQEQWQLQAVSCAWVDCLTLLQRGDIDLLPDVAYSTEREKRMAFHSTPVLLSWSQLFSRADLQLESPLDLAGLRVAVLGDSIQQEYLQTLGAGFSIEIRFVSVPSLQQAFEQVHYGEADVAVANQLYGDYHAAEYELRPTPIIFQPARLFYATPLQRGDALRQAIDYWLERWKAQPDSPYYEVLRRWGPRLQGEQELSPYLLWGMAALVIVLMALGVFTALLRFKVRDKTRHLQLSENRLNTILGSVDAYIYIKGRDYRYRYVNPRVLELLGCAEEEIIGERDDRFFDAETVRQLRETDKRVMERGERVVKDEYTRRPNHNELCIYLAVKQPLRDEEGKIIGLVGVSTDVTERRRNEEQIHQLAFYDPLTGLPNQSLLRQRLDHALATAARSGLEGAVLFIDLDNFRDLNDTLGHRAGDQLLKAVAERLDLRVREGDTLARFGGDEFVVVLEGMEGERDEALYQIESAARQILALINSAFELGGRTYTVSASMGVVLFSDARHSGDELLKGAELAMYAAKSSGRNKLLFFDQSMQARVNTRIELEHGIRHALERNEFQLYYQPQFDSDGQLLGVESLVRWNHPQQGVISPAKFIPVAEASGLIVPLGRWILQSACDQLVRWSSDEQFSKICIAVNISAHQIHHEGFVSGLLAVLERTGADARKLKLELTESLLVQDIEQIIAKMAVLREHSVGFSLDDFGTGYSSLSYLKRLPLDQLKIDQSFVRDLLQDSNDAAIVRTIIALGKSLDLAVIAEGVETEEQRQALLDYGCFNFQGYLFSRPLPADQLEQFLRQRDGGKG